MRTSATRDSGRNMTAIGVALISASWLAVMGCGSRPDGQSDGTNLDSVSALEQMGAAIIDGEKLGHSSPGIAIRGPGVLYDSEDLWEGGRWSNEALLSLALLHRQGQANWISMNGTPLSDAGLEEMVDSLPELEALLVGRTQISDKGLLHVGKLGRLKVLWLWETGVTDAGLPHLTSLNQLVELHLQGTAVTDAGLAHLSQLAALKSLNLADTGITDAGLPHLKSLGGLEHLYVHGTQITEEGVRQIRTALPNCKVVGTNDKIIADETVHIERMTDELLEAHTRRAKAHAAVGEKDKAAMDFGIVAAACASGSSGQSVDRANDHE